MNPEEPLIKIEFTLFEMGQLLALVDTYKEVLINEPESHLYGKVYEALESFREKNNG